MCKLSIIVPIYNVELYLLDCLKSLESQTVQEFEIIMINDGSTDGSGDIARNYMKNHKNVRYIEQENRGLSEARNEGLKYARGEYILFLDSDDWLDSKAVEIIYNNLENQVDVLLFSGKMRKHLINEVEEEHFGIKNTFVSCNKGIHLN